MLLDGDYRVLSKDNIDEMSVMTGKTRNELEKTLTECENFGDVQVLWRQGNHWFGLRVDGQYVYQGLLDRVVEKAMESAVREMAYEQDHRNE